MSLVPKCPRTEMSQGPKCPRTEMSLVPKCPRTEMSQGPKCPRTEMSHLLLGTEMSQVPKCPRTEMSPVPKCLVPKCRYRNVPGRNVWYRNSQQPSKVPPLFAYSELIFDRENFARSMNHQNCDWG